MTTCNDGKLPIMDVCFLWAINATVGFNEINTADWTLSIYWLIDTFSKLYTKIMVCKVFDQLVGFPVLDLIRLKCNTELSQPCGERLRAPGSWRPGSDLPVCASLPVTEAIDQTAILLQDKHSWGDFLCCTVLFVVCRLNWVKCAYGTCSSCVFFRGGGGV